MDSKLVKAIFKRTTALSRLRESYAVSKEYEKNPAQKMLVIAHYDDIHSIYEDFSTIHNDIIGLINDDEATFKEHDSIRREADKLYYGFKAIYTSLIQSDATAQVTMPLTTPSQVPKLPQISIPIFDGDYKMWPTFFDLFTNIVHQNVQLSNIEKFQYLATSLTKDPLSVINTIAMTDDNYPIAYEALVKRYQNKRYLATRYWSEIIDSPVLHKSGPTDLRKILDIFSENLAALRALDFPVDQWNFVLLNLLLNKLDVKTRTDFELKFSKVELPSYKQLYQFLEGHCHALEAVQILPSSLSHKNQQNRQISSNKVSHKPTSTFTASSPESSNNLPSCLLCDVAHPLYRCSVFAAKSVSERFDFVKSKKLCINCLSRTHSLVNCRSKSSCRVCHARHHSLLHRDTQPNNPIASSSINSAEPEVHHVSLSAGTLGRQEYTVMLSTAIVEIRDAQGSFQTARVMFDSGSMANFVTHDCLKRLRLSYTKSAIPIEGLNGSTLSGTQGLTRCFIRSRNDPSVVFDFGAIVLPKICSTQPKFTLDRAQWSHIRSLQLSDDNCHIPGKIDILLGAELIPYIFEEHRIFGDTNQPVAISTKFGWILQGKAACSNTYQSTIHSFHTALESPSLETLLHRFWEVESVPQTLHISRDNAKCEEIFTSTTKRDLDGRFIVALPFRETNVNFGDTYKNTLRRFVSLERRLLQKPELHQEYCSFMRNYLDSGYMSLVPPDGTHSSTAYYIPHHCVIKPDSTTTRLRVVFDASAKGTLGLSLNDVLLTGPKLQKDIVSILLNFRVYAVAFTCDLKQMYLQIRVVPEHRDFQRIFWRFSVDEVIREYCLNTVTFGVSSSPFLALRTIIELAAIGKSKFPLAAQAMQENIYVDDVVSGARTLEDALELRNELIELFATAGFDLRKWASNETRVIDGVSAVPNASISFDKEYPASIKVLGLHWNPREDVFSYSCNAIDIECTKRSILSRIARIYDPLGFLSPVLLYAKQLMQKLWSSKCDWDEAPSPSICNAWTQFNAELSELHTIKIPRYVFADCRGRIELHGFSDASQLGYGAVVYLRVEHESNDLSTFLCYAKAKVAPVKTVSLPRLELLGAVLLTNLILKVLETASFKIDRVYAWTDSEIVLTWIALDPNRWKTFVANRVAFIQESIPCAHWQYVPSKENPADCASRGLLPSALCTHSLWWQGPAWLRGSMRPSQPKVITQSTEIAAEESKLALNVVVDSQVLSHLLNRFSSLRKIQRTLAYVLRFISNSRGNVRLTEGLLPAELNKALLVLVQLVQTECFADIRKALHKDKLLPKPLRKLNPFLDDQGLIRVGGRLRHSQLAFSAKHPMLLPGDHLLTRLIVSEAHTQNLHAGYKTLSNILLQKFWILSPRRTINRCLSNCHRCFKTKPKSLTPIMGNLPACRINQVRAFLSVCLDYAGPFLVTALRGRGMKSHKAYVCVFVCCATRAIHLELVTDLSSETFLQAFQRFTSRRGRCIEIHSDQGTNFIGANRLLNDLARQAAVKLEILWHFNPPSAPHFNGLAEAGVKSTKTHLTRVVGNQILSFEEFNTLIARIESILNSRPLCPLSSDPNDLQPLTPAHFLLLEPLGSDFPEPNLSDIPQNRLNRFQLLSRMVAHFWNRWHHEYLHTLQQRAKWTEPSKVFVKVGSLVIVKNDNEPPKNWILARVLAVHPGPDGIVRVATVRTATGEFQRPLTKLCPLPSSN